MNNYETKVITYLTYENVLAEIEKNGLILPLTYLENPQNIDDFITLLITEFEPIEAISYSSFLNAVTQTCPANESVTLGKREIKAAGLETNPPEGILFHRDNLLHFIVQIINSSKINGRKKIRGEGRDPNATRNYYKTLLLISSKLNKTNENPEYVVLKELIRTYPYYYLPKLTYTIYSIRIKRYWYIYNDVINSLKDNRKNEIANGIKSIEKYTGVSINEHLYIVNSMFNWFINVPLKKRQYPEDDSIKNLGFNYNALDTFYINIRNFADNNGLIKLIDKYSLDYNGFKQLFASNTRRDVIEGFYKNFQDFFDHPIYKIDKDNYCIIDLKYLFEGICSGLIWHLNKISETNLQSFKEQYGYLMEEYFFTIIKRLFNGIKISNKESGKPDATLETDQVVIFFEFTTEYYRFASLYNAGIKEILDDLHRLLFNDGIKDLLSRGKQDKGKFHKIDNYINEIKTTNKRIIPILVTENNLGDYDLLNRFDGFLTNKINDKNLNNLKGVKPLIINLEDIELCWAFCDPKDTSKDFVKYVDDWDRAKKGKYHFNFSSFVSSQNDGKIKNQKYSEFFNYQQFLRDIKN